MSRQPVFLMTFTLSLAALLPSCATTEEKTTSPADEATKPDDDDASSSAAAPTPSVPPGDITDAARAVVDAEDRTDADRKMDARRHPAELLTFMGVQPGWRVADLGAGSGYTTELLARSVGETGQVFAQNNAGTLERFVSKSWPARLEREAVNNVVRVDQEFATPLPPVATELDLVSLIFSYHDVVVAGDDRAAMNKAVFDALKPGGFYVIADHAAAAGSGLEAAEKMHRLEESILRSEVEAAGFILDGEGGFLRDPSDDLTAISYKIGFKTDRYLLRFKKPGA